MGWTQTTNNPAQSDLYGLVVKDGGYLLDGQVTPFDQLPLASRKQMRPMWRTKREIEANLESRKVF